MHVGGKIAFSNASLQADASLDWWVIGLLLNIVRIVGVHFIMGNIAYKPHSDAFKTIYRIFDLFYTPLGLAYFKTMY